MIGDLLKINRLIHHNVSLVSLDVLKPICDITKNDIVLKLDNHLYDHDQYKDYKVLFKNKIGFVSCKFLEVVNKK